MEMVVKFVYFVIENRGENWSNSQKGDQSLNI